MKNENNFFKKPSFKHVIIFTSVWLISLVLLVMASTDLFTESPFQNKYLMTHFIVVYSTVMIVKLNLNYRKNKAAKEVKTTND